MKLFFYYFKHDLTKIYLFYKFIFKYLRKNVFKIKINE
jgi:hypothetical protein